MATVVIPRVLTELEERGRRAGARALGSAMAETAAAVQTSPLMPVNLGLLRSSIVVSEVVSTSTTLSARVLVAGPAAGQLITAHRGASHDAPENPLAAFRQAVRKKAARQVADSTALPTIVDAGADGARPARDRDGVPAGRFAATARQSVARSSPCPLTTARR
jgi:hypothetical protein